MNELRQIIEEAWEDRANLSPGTAQTRAKTTINELLRD